MPSMEVREAVIVDTLRTAFGKRKGALAHWHPTDLLGFALRALIERNDLDPERIDDVVGGCITQSGEQGTNVTRRGSRGGCPRRRSTASAGRRNRPCTSWRPV
jgi:acetyl-CoA acetyltransferase